MQRIREIAIVVAVMAGAAACGEPPVAPESLDGSTISAQTESRGTGLVLDNLTGVSLPLIGQLGDVVVDQAIITDFVLVEDVVGNIVGLQVEGVLSLTGGVLGSEIVSEEFLTQVNVASSGPGRCDIVNIDLGPIALDVLGLASVDAPVVAVTPRASGALGSLLCNLGNLLQGPISGVTAGVRGLVNAINRLI